MAKGTARGSISVNKARALERFPLRRSNSIAAVADVIPTFAWREQVEGDRDERQDLIEAARARGAEKCFQFRERLFDWVEIRAVGWKKAQMRPDLLNGGADVRLFVHRQVIQHHDVSARERGDENLFDIREEARVVDGPVEHGRRGEALQP